MRGLASSRNCAGRPLCDSAVAVVDQGVDAAQRWIVFRENPCFIPHVRFSPPQRADEARGSRPLPRPTRAAAGGSFFWHRLIQSPGLFVPVLYPHSTVVGNMVNIKFCGEFATKNERMQRNITNVAGVAIPGPEWRGIPCSTIAPRWIHRHRLHRLRRGQCGTGRP
jgi:hypothetical protein